jgi:hypothetical protein
MPVTSDYSVNDIMMVLRDFVTLVNELRTDVNALRQDFRRHDHGAAYAAATHRINAGDNTPSGTEASTAVVAAAIADIPQPLVR